MPGILETIRARVGHQTSGGAGGLLSGIGQGGGVLSTTLQPLQARLASVQAAGTLQSKIQALSSTLGTRVRSLTAGGGLLSGLGGAGTGSSGTGSSGTSADSFEARSGTARVLANPNPPPGVEFH